MDQAELSGAQREIMEIFWDEQRELTASEVRRAASDISRASSRRRSVDMRRYTVIWKAWASGVVSRARIGSKHITDG